MIGKLGNGIIKLLQEQEFESAVQTATQSFMRLNTLWLKLGATKQQVHPYLRNKLLTTLQGKHSIIVKHQNSIKAIVVALDLYQYTKLPQFPIYNFHLFKELSKYAQVVQKEMIKMVNGANHSVYAIYGIVDHTWANQGLSLQFWLFCMEYYRTKGFKYLYSRISHIASLQICLKIGGWVLNYLDLGKENKELKGQYIWTICVPCDFGRVPVKKKIRAKL